MKPTKLLPLIICVALILSASMPVLAAPPAVERAQETEPDQPEPKGLRPDAPPYAVRGPHAVGVRDFVIEPAMEGQRTLKATVWYPAQNPWGVAERYTYDTGSKTGFEFGDLPALHVYGHGLQDALPLTDDAPYPLFVYSHALGAFPGEAPYLMEQLASHGFVVIAADHRDSWGGFPNPNLASDLYWRPAEVTRQIDFAEGLGGEGGALEGMIDTQQVAVGGYSKGAVTALISGGARIDLDYQRTWCEENTVDDEPPDEDCTTVTGHEEELAEAADLDNVPEGLWPDWSDPRVDAVISLAPGMAALGHDGIASLELPVLFMIGGADDDAGPTYWPNDPYANVTSERKAQVIFDHASHMMFWEDCEDFPGMADLGWHFACMEAVWDKDRAHDLINHFATAFLLAELKGDQEAAAALAADEVDFPGIQYDSAGYAATAGLSTSSAAFVSAAESELISGYVDNNEVRIYYEVEGQGPPLLLIHWAGGSTQDWRMFGWVDALNDYRLIMVDMRGHGKSDKPHDPTAYGAATQMDDIVAVLDKLGIEKTHGFGYSLGGKLGWALAKYAPERLHSLIIAGKAPAVWDDSDWAAQRLNADAETQARGFEDFARAGRVAT